MQIINNLGMIIDPVAQYHENSRFYSAVRPEPNKEVDHALPHVTIEMPVYKESLEQTTFICSPGGTSATFIHDDGLQLIPENERSEFARPPNDSSPGGFKRTGRFRKASKMNYGLTLSLKLEWHLKAPDEAEKRGHFQVFDEEVPLEESASRMACDEGWKPWASNGRSIRIREIILLVDPDTIVTEDCLRDAVRELGESPEVAKIRHNSDVTQIARHYFENGTAHFTRRINKAISLGCANGEVAPFVGRNAFLRWSSLREAASTDPADGKKKIHMVQIECCSELIFNPLISWWRLAPVDKQLLHYKFIMMSCA
ncbi:glycosyl transferase family group 2-domain-containing protein [Pisolithus thermaeus]|nr:glycosyl transferase family group 2-domain-containing protein [Pisolithus thermaeus]